MSSSDVEVNTVADYVPTFIGSVMKHIACTPNQNFDDEAYERGVIQTTARIRKLQELLGDEPPTRQQMIEVMALLLTIFETKMVEMEEREDRIRETLDRLQCHDVFPDLLPLKEGLEAQLAQLGLEPGFEPLADVFSAESSQSPATEGADEAASPAAASAADEEQPASSEELEADAATEQEQPRADSEAEVETEPDSDEALAATETDSETGEQAESRPTAES